MYGGIGSYGGGGMGYGGGYGYGASAYGASAYGASPYGGGGMGYGYGGGMGGMMGRMNNMMGPSNSGALAASFAAAQGGTHHQGAVAPQQQQQQNGASAASAASSSTQRLTPQQRRALQRQQEEQAVAARRQRNTFVVGAGLELLMHMTQVLLHSLRSMHDLMSVGVGSYYAIQGIRTVLPLLRGEAPSAAAGANGAEWAKAMGGGSGVTVARGGAAAAAAPPAPGGIVARLYSSRKVRMAVIFVALYVLGEMLVSRIMQRRAQQQQHDAMLRARAELHEEEGVSESEIETGSAVSESDDAAESVSDAELRVGTRRSARTAASGDVARGGPTASGAEAAGSGAPAAAAADTAQSVFVALYDYEAQGPGQLSFRAGDQVYISSFDPSGWCVAAPTQVTQQRRMNFGYDMEEVGDDDGRAGEGELLGAAAGAHPGLVPGNFFQPLPMTQKF